MNDLEMYREQLAICDDKIIDALVERNSIVEKIMAYKETYGMPILQPAQEAKQQHRLEEKLKGWLGTKVSIARKKNNKGKIEIEYYSQEELERLVDLFGSIN